MKKRRLLWMIPPLLVIFVMAGLALRPDRESQTAAQFEAHREILEELAMLALEQGDADGITPPAPWRSVELYAKGIPNVEFDLGSGGFASQTVYWGVNYVPSDNMVGYQGLQWDYWKAQGEGRLYYDPEGDNTCYVRKLDECWYYYEMSF